MSRSRNPSDQAPIADATRVLFERYASIIEEAGPDTLSTDPRLGLDNLLWLCREGAKKVHELPIDKTSRWLGFVQGCLAMRGLVTVDGERDASRPLFHAAYREAGLAAPATVERET